MLGGGRHQGSKQTEGKVGMRGNRGMGLGARVGDD